MADPKGQVITLLNYVAGSGRGAALIRNFDLDVLFLVGEMSLKADLVAIARRHRDKDEPLVFSDGHFIVGKVGLAHAVIVVSDATLPISPAMMSRVERGCSLLTRIVNLAEPIAYERPSPASGSGGGGAPAEVSLARPRSSEPPKRKPGN